ncbi:hypothetical protein AB0C69_24360, partial [Actinomadura sp. NPDC048032]|uniref:hypothetical protein n=1 Tax=Actinomadura sp. NPDC048032 TaxID=3155747 RepID=UPI0033C6572F
MRTREMRHPCRLQFTGGSAFPPAAEPGRQGGAYQRGVEQHGLAVEQDQESGTLLSSDGPVAGRKYAATGE